MTVLVLLGAPGAGKGTPGRGPPSGSASRTSRPATCSARPSATARRSASRRAATWSEASSCPTTSRSGCCSTGSASRDARRRRDPRRLPANRRPGRGARRGARRARRRVDRAVEHRGPADELVRRLSGRWICAASGPRLQRGDPPAAGARRLRRRRLAAHPARGRPGRDRSGPGSHQQLGAPARGRRLLPRARASCARSTGVARSTQVTADLLAAARRRRCGRQPDVVTRKSQRRDRPDAPRRPDRRRGPRARRVGAQARRLDRPPRRARRGAHPAGSGAVPSFKGYPGVNPRRPFPASMCISIDDEIVHGIPGDRTIREGQVVSIDAGAIVDGWHGDARPDLLRRRRRRPRSSGSSTRPAWR